MKKVSNYFVYASCAIALAFSTASFAKTCSNEAPAPAMASAPAPGQPVDLTYAAEKALPAVVHIKFVQNSKTQVVDVQDPFSDFFDPFGFFGERGNGGTRKQQVQTPKKQGAGSGVIISADGYIVTNNHVVEGADELTVTLNDNSEYSARIIGTDKNTDLALIKINGKNLPTLPIGDSDKLKVGEWVLAVGNPFNLTSTVTAGIVSAKARNLSILGEGTSVESFIQTDAAVNPGNSGGALVNTKGELVGINAAIASHTGSYEGYSFAIPSNIVRKVVDDLLLYGETQRGYLGIRYAELTAELAEKEGLEDIDGVYVAEVIEDGAAKIAGMKNGDVITAINGKKVNTGTQLMESVRQFRPGDKIDVEVNRDGHHHHYTLTLLNEAGNVDVVKKGESFFNSDLGLMLQPVNQNDMSRLNIKSGLKIVEIRQGRFMGSGITEGFVITKVNGNAVNSKTDLENALKNNRSRRTSMEGVYPNGMVVNFYFN